jgi:transcriptional regulator with XRE-family HTH domain
MPYEDVIEDPAAAGRMLGRKVRAARRAQGLSQRELAQRTHLSRSQIQNIELNRTKGADTVGSINPHQATIVALAEALDVEVAYLIDPHQPVRHSHY